GPRGVASGERPRPDAAQRAGRLRPMRPTDGGARHPPRGQPALRLRRGEAGIRRAARPRALPPRGGPAGRGGPPPGPPARRGRRGGGGGGRERAGRGAERGGGARGGRPRHWRQTLERAEYEAGRARRQYDAVDPENRLVARELERQWERRLVDRRRLEEEYA